MFVILLIIIIIIYIKRDEINNIDIINNSSIGSSNFNDIFIPEITICNNAVNNAINSIILIC